MQYWGYLHVINATVYEYVKWCSENVFGQKWGSHLCWKNRPMRSPTVFPRILPQNSERSVALNLLWVSWVTKSVPYSSDRLTMRCTWDARTCQWRHMRQEWRSDETNCEMSVSLTRMAHKLNITPHLSDLIWSRPSGFCPSSVLAGVGKPRQLGLRLGHRCCRNEVFHWTDWITGSHTKDLHTVTGSHSLQSGSMSLASLARQHAAAAHASQWRRRSLRETIETWEPWVFRAMFSINHNWIQRGTVNCWLLPSSIHLGGWPMIYNSFFFLSSDSSLDSNFQMKNCELWRRNCEVPTSVSPSMVLLAQMHLWV